MKVAALLLLSALSLVAARPRDQSQLPQFDTFFAGLVNGFQLNSTTGPCVNALNAAEGDIAAFIGDFYQMVNGDETAITYFLLDGRDMLGDFHVSNQVCNFGGLWDAISALGTVPGQQQLTLSFTINSGVFLLDFKQLALCGVNWTKCGFAVGELLRMTLSWGIY